MILLNSSSQYGIYVAKKGISHLCNYGILKYVPSIL